MAVDPSYYEVHMLIIEREGTKLELDTRGLSLTGRRYFVFVWQQRERGKEAPLGRNGNVFAVPAC